MNKRNLIIAACLASAATVLAENVVFDFHNPATLNPSIAEPEVKGSVELDGQTFTSANVKVTFAASGENNTRVRIYNSYDAGIDLRLYNNDSMTVSVDGDSYISKIQFTMSLSGAASGTNDINFIPSTGEFVWEDEAWTPDDDTQPKSVELFSALQSRIYTMTVSVEPASSIANITAADGPVSYYSIVGHRLPGKPSQPGVYIAVGSNGESRKITLR